MIDMYRGGGERVCLDLMKGFLEKGYAVDLLLMKKRGPYMSQIPPEVNIIVFDSKRIIQTLPKVAGYLKREKPLAILSITKHTHLITILAKILVRVKTKVIVRFGIPFSTVVEKKNLGEHLMPYLVKIFHPKADAMIAVSKNIAEELKLQFPACKEKVSAIYNPKFLDHIKLKAREEVVEPWLKNKTEPVVIAIGRLAYVKGFDVLIKAFALATKEVSARLIILGEGGEKENLEKLIEENQLENKVKFVPFQDNPYSYMSKSDLFVLSSRMEGMPNALIEALVCGVPVIATDCVSGPREILVPNSSNQFGILVPVDAVEELSREIKEMLTNKDKQLDYKRRSEKRAEDFSHDKIINQYLEVFNS